MKRCVLVVMLLLGIALCGVPVGADVGKIVFYSARSGGGDIFVMNPDGTSQTNLSNTAGIQEGAPRWRWDGGKIVYQRTDALWTMNPDGSGQAVLSQGGGPQSPDFHPSGNPIIFSRPITSDYDIVRVNADGTGLAQILSNSLGDYFARWSPDGTKFTFYTFFGGTNTPEVCIANANGSGQTRLTTAGNSQNASWSPDGGLIVFQSSRDGNNEIYLMNPDGTNQTRLTNDSASDTSPVFSPDGAKIAFVSNRDGNNNIYVMNADGTNQTRLTTNGTDDNSPSWQQTLPADAPSVSINDVTLTEGDAGTQNAAFTVSLSAASTSPVTVTVRTYDGTAKAGLDYTALAGTTLTFAPGETSQILNVPVAGDTLDELDESFSVRLSAIGASFGDPVGVATIQDDDAAPLLNINDVTLTEGNVGTTNATFTVTASSVSGKSITVQYATANGTAVSGSDYSTGSGTLTIPVGQTSATISVAIIGDTVLEENETFFVNLSNPNNATLLDVQGQGTITNDDLFPSLVINDVTVAEGGAATFVVSLSMAAAQPVTLTYATNNISATAGSDYTEASGAVTIPAGDTSADITVTTLDDTALENNETFALNLSNINGAIVQDSTGQGTITSEDVPEVFIGDATLREGNAAPRAIYFAIALSEPAPFTVTVNYATSDGVAVAGSDYTSSSGAVSFSAGQTSKSVAVNLTGDLSYETDEAFFVNLSNATNATITGAQGTGTIINDDAIPAIRINDLTLAEGLSGTTNAVFTVTLIAPSILDVTVDYTTTDGSANAGTDFGGLTGSLTIPAGQTSGTITVVVNGDATVEGDETFFVDLTNPANGTIADVQGRATILNDDPTPAASIGDVSVVEGNTGTVSATFTVTLSSPAILPVTLSYATTDGTAAAGSDYTTKSGTLTIPAGQTSGTISVNVAGDISFEANETFSVTLSNPINSTLGDNQAIGTITNDDIVPSFIISDATVTEGNAGTVNANFTVSLSVASGVTVTVKYATATPGSLPATPGVDYIAVPLTTLTFAPGQTSKIVTVQVNGDLLDEPNEKIQVSLSGATNATIADKEAAGTITDDDAAPSLSINDISVTEGDTGTVSANFTVSLSAPSGQTVTVKYATATPTTNPATPGVDYVAMALTTLTFAPGETTKTVTITVNGDTTVEGDERFTVKLSGATNATIADNEGLGTITNDDVALILGKPVVTEEPSE